MSSVRTICVKRGCDPTLANPVTSISLTYDILIDLVCIRLHLSLSCYCVAHLKRDSSFCSVFLIKVEHIITFTVPCAGSSIPPVDSILIRCKNGDVYIYVICIPFKDLVLLKSFYLMIIEMKCED